MPISRSSITDAKHTTRRSAARARADHDRDGFWHWAKVAAEIARLSPDVDMDMKTVEAIAVKERHRRRDRP